MTSNKERSLTELYGSDPERADAAIFGRRTGASRRGFLGGAGLAAIGAAVGGTIPFASNMPAGLIPAALAQDTKANPPATTAPATAPPPAVKGPETLQFPGKDPGLVVLGDKPLVAETPDSLLDDDTTPTAKLFVRNNGLTPEPAKEPDRWQLTIDGEIKAPLKITLGELKSRYKPKTLRMVLECGGNGRSFFSPQARGNQWTNGGAGCCEWTGVALKEVLLAAGLKPSAKYTAHYGTDVHLSGDNKKETLSRGAPIKKMMEDETLIVWAMNGEPLANIHGGPLRLVVPGWPGSLSHKWLSRIWVRDKEHDGQGMLGTSYRVAINPMVPGAKADDKNFKILESMPIRSIVTNPANGTKLAAGTRALKLRGAAWAGDSTVQRVEVSIDFGANWKKVQTIQPKNRFDWARWTGAVNFPSDGYYEIWVKATDGRGVSQPHIAGNWNPQGYGGNSINRIAVLVG